MVGLAPGERLQIMLTDEELAALDDWRFTKRMPSRAAAVRELLKRGLAAEGSSSPPGFTRATSASSSLPNRRFQSRRRSGRALERPASHR